MLKLGFLFTFLLKCIHRFPLRKFANRFYKCKALEFTAIDEASQQIAGI